MGLKLSILHVVTYSFFLLLNQTWSCELIESAQVQEENERFEMEPTNQLKVGNNVQLYSMVRSVNPEEQSIWFAQVSQS
jgi:hypothetical protein